MNLRNQSIKEGLKLMKLELKADIGCGDITSRAVKAKGMMTGLFKAKESGVLSGLSLIKRFYSQVVPKVRISFLKKDGDAVRKGEKIGTLRGDAYDILKSERTVLNMLQHLSGVASATNVLVRKIAEYDTILLDTRKTTPLLRVLEKQAVLDGGGSNHRMGLYDQILIKDNHLSFVRKQHKNDHIAKAVKMAVAAGKGKIKVEVEVESMSHMLDAAGAGADIIMLDNMTPTEMRKCVRVLKKEYGSKRPKLEASGNVTLENIAKVAATGVDFVSSGAVTHSANNLDISLLLSLVSK